MRDYKFGSSKIQQLPSGKYRVRITVPSEDGKQHRVSITGDTQKIVIKKAEDYLRQNAKASTLTVRKSIEQYIKTCQIAGHSPSTISGYQKIMRTGINVIGDIPIDRLRSTDVQMQVNNRSIGHAPKTVYNDFGLIHRVLSIYAPDLNLEQIVLPTKRNEINADVGITIPTSDQLLTLIQITGQKDVELYKAILLASQLGLRRSEICALQWQDINFHFNCMEINKAVVRDQDRIYRTKATKSKAGERTISIPDSLCDILYDMRDKIGNVVDLTPDAVTRRYGRLRDKLGIPGRFHDLRHYHASVLVANNVPETYAMREMGHSTPNLYKRVYAHMFPQQIAVMNDALNKSCNDLLNKIPTKLTGEK